MSSSTERIKTAFIKAITSKDKELCINIAINALEKEDISPVELYEKVLAPSLYNIAGNYKEQEMAIWEEHVISGIVRTIIEICYPYILKERNKENYDLPMPKAVIFCQEEEYHELGARMATDFLTILGFDACFIGANTPKEEAVDALLKIRPALVCISVTNYFHLTKTNVIIKDMRNAYEKPFTIVVGGYAAHNTPHAKEKINADYFAMSFEDLKNVKENIK